MFIKRTLQLSLCGLVFAIAGRSQATPTPFQASQQAAAKMFVLSASQQEALAVALTPLVEVCARHRLPLERAAEQLIALPQDKQHVVAALVARHLDDALQQQALMPLTLPLMLHRTASLAAGGSEIIALINHLEALDYTPSDWLQGPMGPIRHIVDHPDHRRLAVIAALRALSADEPRGETTRFFNLHFIRMSLGELREVTLRANLRYRSAQGSGPSSSQAKALVEEVRKEGWRGSHCTDLQFGTLSTPPTFDRPALVAAPGPQAAGFFFPPSPYLGQQSAEAPADCEVRAFGEWARDALGRLDLCAADSLGPEVAARAIREIYAEIEELWPSGRATSHHAAHAGQSSRRIQAAEVLAKLVAHGPLIKLAAVRADRQPLPAEEVIAMSWLAIGGFDPTGDERGLRRDGAPERLPAGDIANLKGMLRRLFVESLSRCATPGAVDFDPYPVIAQLFGELRPYVRNRQPSDTEALLASMDDKAIFKQLCDAFARRDRRDDAAMAGHAVGTQAFGAWYAQVWMGLCLAKAESIWELPDHPARQRLMARCLVRAGDIRDVKSLEATE